MVKEITNLYPVGTKLMKEVLDYLLKVNDKDNLDDLSKLSPQDLYNYYVNVLSTNFKDTISNKVKDKNEVLASLTEFEDIAFTDIENFYYVCDINNNFGIYINHVLIYVGQYDNSKQSNEDIVICKLFIYLKFSFFEIKKLRINNS